MDRYQSSLGAAAALSRQAEKSLSPLRLSLKDQLQREIEDCEAKIVRNKEMIEILDANPAIARFIDLSESR